MKRVRILDLDNCISNDGWRMDKINWQKSHPNDRYHEYHLLAAFDLPGNPQLFEDSPEAIVVLTARPNMYRANTQEWLRRQGIKPLALIMRNDNDTRSSVDVKREQLGWLHSYYAISLSDIAHAYDDRQDIVDMYRTMGIPATRIWIHEQCAMTKPEAA